MLCITLGLPILLAFFALVTNEDYSVQGIALDFDAVLKQLPSTREDVIALAFDKDCWLAYLAWFGSLVALDFLLPGKHIEGVELRDGTKLNYKINGLAMSGCLLVLLA